MRGDRACVRVPHAGGETPAWEIEKCSAYTELILPEDSQYTYAVSMEKENGYLLELYFTAITDDGTYFLVTCCYNPIDTASRYATQTAVFSMETQ